MTTKIVVEFNDKFPPYEAMGRLLELLEIEQENL